MSHKIFDSDLVGIRKTKVTLTLNKPAYIGMCILDISKVLMYEFHYDYTKNKYGNNSNSYSQTLIVKFMELKLKMSIKILAGIKKCLILLIIWLSQNTMIIQRNQSLDKLKMKKLVLRLKHLLD